VGAIRKKDASLCDARNLRLPRVTNSDPSAVDPEAVVASSHSLGWQNVHAVQVHHELVEWATPPLENHCIVIQLGAPVRLGARIGIHDFDGRWQTGEIVVVPAGLLSQWRRKGAGVHSALHLYLHPHYVRTIAESVDLDHAQSSIEPQFGVGDEHIHHIGMSLLYELKESNVVGRLYADSLARALAMQFVRRYSCLKDVQTSCGGMAPRKLRKAIEFINENLDKGQTVTLAAVAEAVQMSYFHFSRAFKKSMGVGPKIYMIRQQVDRAKRLLSETDLSIAEIALRVGFVSQSHFTNTFRRLAWTSPMRFRGTLKLTRARRKQTWAEFRKNRIAAGIYNHQVS
jgi:AraC family transcriptional regulator